MKKIILPYIILLTVLQSCGQTKEKKEPETAGNYESLIPKEPIGFVSDFEKIFTPSQVTYLDSIAQAHQDKTTNQLAVVTLPLDSTNIKNVDDFSMFAKALFNKWGVGQRDKNNGVGILISTNLKSVRISVGTGLEEKLTDDEAQSIISSIILPAFRSGEFFNGVKEAVFAVMKEVQ